MKLTCCTVGKLPMWQEQHGGTTIEMRHLANTAFLDGATACGSSLSWILQAIEWRVTPRVYVVHTLSAPAPVTEIQLRCAACRPVDY